MPANKKDKLDLHAHSNYSDGTLPPADVVRRAAASGVAVLVLTDHDSVSGFAEAREAGIAAGVEVRCGVEINTREHDTLHILGYGIDPASAGLEAALEDFRGRRERRLRAIVGKLAAAGLPLAWADVDGVSRQTLGRPHVADALVRKGAARSRKEAFDRWLTPGKPGYVGPMGPAPEEAIGVIRAAGGWACLAHPGDPNGGERIARLASAGLAGLEVYYPTHTRATVEKLKSLAGRFDLTPTGGSDFHGPKSGRDGIGLVDIPAAEAELLLSRV